MSSSLMIAAGALLNREPPLLVAATGLLFQRLNDLAKVSLLRDVLESYRGGVWGELTTTESGYPVLRSTNMRGSTVDTSDAARVILPPNQAKACTLVTGDILIVKSSGSSDLVGKAALFVHPGSSQTYLFSNFTLRLRPETSVVFPEFLAWFLRSPQSLMWRISTQQNSVGLRNLQVTEFLKQRIPIPTLQDQRAIARYLNALEEGDESAEKMDLPDYLREQRRIVARIEELGAKVQKAKDLRRETMERVDQLKAGYFQAAFNGPETDHWQKVKLVTISRITSGGTPSRRDPFNFIGEIRWVKTLDLNCDVVRETEECISESALTQIRGEILPVGTVMIAMYGGAGTIGKSGILGIPAATNQAICSILPNPEVFVPEFLHYWVLLIRSKWMDYGVGTRIDPNINKGIIERMDFLLPSLAEQCRVVAYLDDLQARADPLGQLQAETGTRLDALLPSILDKAFKGQLH